MASGWTAAVLLVFRLVWGFIGGEHARFANFVRPSRLLSHVRELVTGHPQRTIGHNPLGALAVLAMPIATGAVLWTGIQVDAGQADEDLHEAIAYGLLALIDRKSTRLNSSHSCASRMTSSPCNNKTNQ